MKIPPYQSAEEKALTFNIEEGYQVSGHPIFSCLGKCPESQDPSIKPILSHEEARETLPVVFTFHQKGTTSVHVQSAI